MQLIIGIALFATTAVALPQQPNAPTYVTGFPICNVTGFTQVPGPYEQWTYRASDTDVWECLGACRASRKCHSVSYNAIYAGCWHYNQPVNGTQLIADSTSSFAHFDEKCKPNAGSPMFKDLGDYPDFDDPDDNTQDDSSDVELEDHCLSKRRDVEDPVAGNSGNPC